MATIALDFDATIHQYSGWNDGKLSPPIPGAREAILELQSRGFDVVIYTTRDYHQVLAWLVDYDFPSGLAVTNTKPLCIVLVDDRVIRFDGVWTPEFIATVACFEPYWKRHGQP